MSRPDEAVELFRGSYSCSQAVLLAYAPGFGLTEDEATRLGAGFGGGMRLGGECGAVTGAVMVLGLALCGDGCATGEGREVVVSSVQEFGERFEDHMGSLDCAGILDCDVRTVEGSAKAREDGLYDTVCPEAVRQAALILEDLLQIRDAG